MPGLRRLFQYGAAQAAIILLIGGIWPVRAAESPGAPADSAASELAQRPFTLQVLPLLKSKCFACHGAEKDEIKGGLDLTTRAGLLRGGESEEPAVEPGKPESSPLLAAVRWEGLEMPPKENDRLTA